jgi:DNA primase
MTTETAFIPKDKIDAVKDRALLEDVAGDYLVLKPKGSGLVADCPCCGAKGKFEVTRRNSKFPRGIYKCWSCDKSGLDAVNFLTTTQGISWQEAVQHLAGKYSISLEDDHEGAARRSKTNVAESFCKNQLRASGIPEKAIKYKFKENDEKSTERELSRYLKGTIDRYGNFDPTGDDMVIHYLNLDWSPVMYQATDGEGRKLGKMRPLTRVRWQVPELHKSKDGRPMKYQSPTGSGSHLYLPNVIINHFKTKAQFDTLYICEGEKKADKMSLHGMPAVGIMGIHNFATDGHMPSQFEQIISTCGVKNVVFVLDSDWQELSAKSQKSVDQRPRTFYSAVLKFRKYFYDYAASGLAELRIYFAYGKDKIQKGMDDVLVYSLKGQESALLKDFQDALNARDGKGEHVNAHDITSMSDYKLQEFWNLHSIPAFLHAHKEELKPLGEFVFQNMKRRYNAETDEFELADKILPAERFWDITYVGKGAASREEISINYLKLHRFLANRGFYIHRLGDEIFRIVRVQENIIEELPNVDVRIFAKNYLEQEGVGEAVINKIIQGGSFYFGDDKLIYLPNLPNDFLTSDRETHYMVFQNCYWKITAHGIESRPLSEMQKKVWKNRVIDFSPEYIGKPMVEYKRDGERWMLNDYAAQADKCELLTFFRQTSNQHWMKEEELVEGEDGIKRWEKRRAPNASATPEDIQTMNQHVVCKMLASGYTLHDHYDRSEMKGVICMDMEESEVGRSQGGTGKSIWGTSFQYCLPAFKIDGKDQRILKDSHMFEGVDERTQCVIFNDLRVNFDFENYFSKITEGLWVNPKGKKAVFVGLKRWIFNTNHAVAGRDNSTMRRQYFLAFSNYYNPNRTPKDYFGHQLFDDWGHEQWNLYYNFMATCAMHFLRFGLKYTIPQGDIERRKMRQDIGENLLNWCELVFDAGDDSGEGYLNRKCEKDWLMEQYLKNHPRDRQFIDGRSFKERLSLFAKYAGLDFNPGADKTGRVKSGPVEYLVLANESYDKANARVMPVREFSNNSNPFV